MRSQALLNVLPALLSLQPLPLLVSRQHRGLRRNLDQPSRQSRAHQLLNSYFMFGMRTPEELGSTHPPQGHAEQFPGQ